MQTPQFKDGQFVDGTLLNGAVAQLMSDFELIGSELHTAGLLNPSSLTFTPSNLTVTVQAPPPFAVLFGSGLVAQANGVVSGAVSSTYVVACSSLVPVSGPAVTVYLLGSYGQIGQQETQIIGPPQGHPDFDPTFSPFQFYLENLDTLGISASLTPPNNTTTFELAHFSLAVGQNTITQGSIFSTWKYASAVLNPTGVAAGTYPGATVTVQTDGRISNITSAAYGLLAANNTWTGTTNTFDSIRAVSGVTSGNLQTMPNLGDFPFTASTNGSAKLPNGMTLQWGNVLIQGTTWGGIFAPLQDFPEPFQSECLTCVICEGGAGTWTAGTATMWAVNTFTKTSYQPVALLWNGTQFVGPTINMGYRFWAVGV